MLAVYLSMLETDEERRSFGEYYEKHHGRCLAVANAITKNRAWAEEAVQNAFMRMIRHKEKYFTEERQRTATTIVIMVESEALNLLKREKRFTHFDLDDIEPIIANDEPEAFRVVAGKEALQRIEQHISGLDETNRNLYEMRYTQGYSDGEIAEIVKMQKNTVAKRLSRIRIELTKVLREEGYTDE